MTTPDTVNFSPLVYVSGTAVTLLAVQVVHTILANPGAGGMTLTMPSAADFIALPGTILLGAQADFTLVNRSTSNSVTVTTTSAIGDMEVQADHAAIFRMVWHTATSFFLLRIGGTDSTGDIVSSDAVTISSSSNTSPAVTVTSTANFGGISITSPGTSAVLTLSAGTGGVNLTSALGLITIASTNTSSEAVKINVGGGAGGILIDAGSNGLVVRSTGGTARFESTTGVVNLIASAISGRLNIDAGTGGLRFNGGAGTKSMGFFGATPVAQRTAANSTDEAITAAGSVGAVFGDTEWDGYTIGQIVGALEAYGILNNT